MKAIQLIKSEKGSTLLITMMMMVVFGMAAMGATQLVSNERGASVNEYQNNQVMGIGTAGLEYAMRQVDLGLSPNVNNFQFAGGSFDVTSNPNGREITVTSRFGAATKQETIQRNFAADCLSVDTQYAYRNFDRINGLSFAKTCNQNVTIKAIKMTWNSHSCATSQLHWPVNGVDLEQLCDNQGLIDTHEAKLIHIGFDTTAIYDAHDGIGTPLTGAESGEEVDITDVVIADSNTHYFADAQDEHGEWPGIQIKDNEMEGIPHKTFFTLTFLMNDGSSKKVTFQVH